MAVPWAPPVSYMDRDIGKNELACVYGALILADDDIPVTADKLSTVIKAANIQIESVWPSLFARALRGVNVKDLIVGGLGAGDSPGGGEGGAAGPGTAAGDAPAEKPKEEEKKPEPEEEEDSDEDFGLGLFD